MLKTLIRVGSLFPAFLFHTFLIEGTALAASWSKFTTPNSVGAQPTVLHNFTPQPASSLGTNIVTLAPTYFNNGYDWLELAVLTDGTPDSNVDYPAAFYSTEYSPGDWGPFAGYYAGLVDQYGGPGVVGWTKGGGGQLYYNDTFVSTATGVTSYASAETYGGTDYGTVTSKTYNCKSDTPGGWCIFGASNVSTAPVWSEWAHGGEGAYQVTTDTIIGLTWFIDKNGRVWANLQNGEVTNQICNDGGSIVAAQIAVKNWYVYALNDEAIYVSDDFGCWNPIGAPSGVTAFKSIATDNSSVAINQFDRLLWASDQSGNIWFYQ